MWIATLAFGSFAMTGKVLRLRNPRLAFARLAMTGEVAYRADTFAMTDDKGTKSNFINTLCKAIWQSVDESQIYI